MNFIAFNNHVRFELFRIKEASQEKKVATLIELFKKLTPQVKDQRERVEITDFTMQIISDLSGGKKEIVNQAFSSLGLKPIQSLDMEVEVLKKGREITISCIDGKSVKIPAEVVEMIPYFKQVLSYEKAVDKDFASTIGQHKSDQLKMFMDLLINPQKKQQVEKDEDFYALIKLAAYLVLPSVLEVLRMSFIQRFNSIFLEKDEKKIEKFVVDAEKSNYPLKNFFLEVIEQKLLRELKTDLSEFKPETNLEYRILDLYNKASKKKTLGIFDHLLLIFKRENDQEKISYIKSLQEEHCKKFNEKNPNFQIKTLKDKQKIFISEKLFLVEKFQEKGLGSKIEDQLKAWPAFYHDFNELKACFKIIKESLGGRQTVWTYLSQIGYFERAVEFVIHAKLDQKKTDELLNVCFTRILYKNPEVLFAVLLWAQNHKVEVMSIFDLVEIYFRNISQNKTHQENYQLARHLCHQLNEKMLPEAIHASLKFLKQQHYQCDHEEISKELLGLIKNKEERSRIISLLKPVAKNGEVRIVPNPKPLI